MKSTIIAIIGAAILIGGAILFSQSSSNSSGNVDSSIPANNVTIVDGKQIIEIRAKGGYQPRKSAAKAGIPTILRFNTSGTFDCSSSVRIPSMNISKILPQTGAIDIDLGIQKVTTLQGSCGMGMYPFEIDFQN
ncbi:MAG: cupredoxin domain-containing protein [Candidatus Paceibacterota bacterium]